jgi:hypothetical protein
MKSYKQFIRESNEDIHSICRKFKIKNYTINSDGSIDVDGNVYLNSEGLTKLPLKFGNVSRSFFCYSNELTSLEGSPTNVGFDFLCSNNKLTSLIGAPKKVGNTFYCKNNKLTSLVGCPEIIGAQFNCELNKITDFKGISEFFEGDFYCEGNPIWEIWDLFYNYRCIQLINEFDVIQGNKIILDRLEEVFHQLNRTVPIFGEGLSYLPSYEII